MKNKSKLLALLLPEAMHLPALRKLLPAPTPLRALRPAPAMTAPW